MSQGPYHWYQSRPPPVLHRDSEKEPTARKRWGADEEALGPITGIHEKRRREPRKNGEMDWVKLPSVTPLMEQPASVTPLTVVKTAQCHTPNDGIPKEKRTLTNISVSALSHILVKVQQIQILEK